MRKPDFIIIGTQKAGTTWLRNNLFKHSAVSGLTEQIHFFDRNYSKGMQWYSKKFEKFDTSLIIGEKTTEYFNDNAALTVAQRISKDCPDTKLILLLREPISRAFSALQHCVTMGLERLPEDPNKLLFEDLRRGNNGFGYIRRGYYAEQLSAFLDYIPRERILILIFEEDVISTPKIGVEKTLKFLGIETSDSDIEIESQKPIRLSKKNISLMYKFAEVPFARSILRRMDSGIPWRANFSKETRKRLQMLYESENKRLFELLGRNIESWE